MDIEYVKPLYLDELLQPEYNNHRVDINGQRWYVRIYPDDTIIKAPSWTAIKSKCSPVDYGLMEFFKNKTPEQIKWISKNSADYGTFFHVLCGKYLFGEPLRLNTKWLNQCMQVFFEKENMKWGDDRYNYFETLKWIKEEKRDIRKDIYGFSVFCKDWKVKPLAIEYPVMNPKGLYAATIDIVVEMVDPKTEEKFIAIIDIKSTTKGFDYTDYELQLFAQWIEWCNEWPEYQVSRLYNYGCHNYRLPLSEKVTPYKLKEQTFAPHAYKWPLWLKEFHNDPDNIPGNSKTDFKQDAEIRFNENQEVFETYDILNRVKNYNKELF